MARFFEETPCARHGPRAAERPRPNHGASFERLRRNAAVAAEIDPYRQHFARPADHELVVTLEAGDLPFPLRPLLSLESVYRNPVEWSGTMPEMDWIVSGRQVRGCCATPHSRENMDIAWQFRLGDVVKLRLVNDRTALHAMQHPIHIHGQRFLVLSVNGVRERHLVWKDTVLLPTGFVAEVLLEISNPGKWMLHCHVAEHIESGMRMVFEVDSRARRPARSEPDGEMNMARTMLLLATLLVPVALGAQAVTTLSPDVRQYVTVPETSVALTNVRIVDGTGAPPVEGRTLVIENGRIARITAAADAKVPAGTRTIDLSGHTVIPGLVGMHNHTFYTTRGRSVQLQFSAPRLYLGSGLTTIRTTGGTSPYHEINMKRGIDRGQIPGPRMHLTGPYLTGPGGAATMAQIGSPDEARRIVNYWADEGVTWFKAYTDISRETLGAAIRRRTRAG